MRAKIAAILISYLFGRVDIAPELIRICKRESRCSSVGVHARDAHLSATSYWGQVRLGHLDRSCQAYVRKGWATRGPWGLSAAAHWQYMPACYRPEWFDFALVSAVVAVRKYLRHCDGQRGRRWCSGRR